MKVTIEQAAKAVDAAIKSSALHFVTLQTAGIMSVVLAANGRLEQLNALDHGVSSMDRTALRYFIASLNKAAGGNAFAYDTANKAFILGDGKEARKAILAMSEDTLREVKWQKPADSVQVTLDAIFQSTIKRLEKHFENDPIAKEAVVSIQNALRKVGERASAEKAKMTAKSKAGEAKEKAKAFAEADAIKAKRNTAKAKETANA